MKKAFKIFVLVFLLASQVVFAQSDSEKAQSTFEKANVFAKQGNYTKALEYFQKSYKYQAADGTAHNIGLTYEAIKDYSNALKWYKKSFKLGDIKGGVNIGVLYEDDYKDYPKAIKWYKKAFTNGSVMGAYNLGCLYEKKLKNYEKSILWYKEGVKLRDYDSIKNLGNLYYKQNKKIEGAAYMLGLLSIKPLKRDKLIKYLKSNWKLSNKELLKAYILQKKLIPNPYLDPEFEAQIPAPHRNRRGIGR